MFSLSTRSCLSIFALVICSALSIAQTGGTVADRVKALRSLLPNDGNIRCESVRVTSFRLIPDSGAHAGKVLRFCFGSIRDEDAKGAATATVPGTGFPADRSTVFVGNAARCPQTESAAFHFFG